MLSQCRISASTYSQRGVRALVACMWTHCLKSVRLKALDPNWTASWALAPLYCTTLTLDSLPANWKEKHCMVTVCFGLCVLCLQACVFFSQHFCVPTHLTNYIQTGRGESLERYKSEFQNHTILSFTLSVFRPDLRAALKLFSQLFWYYFEQTTKSTEVKCGLSYKG